ncbi:MAG: hypothetical protein CBC29_05860 [Methylococcaceae bacterium TMED69]|nr:MAG: hypothetical protein CBC29_05860 [Methylococcaceae bacterium TMED69]|tara:strand:+ start:48 stop:791 length:744 start_codon:yes stop_codon:yes gene_type:complete
MITANLMGRLGNQMFQIAAATALADRNDDFSCFPTMSRGEGVSLESQKLYSETVFSKVNFTNDFSWCACQYNEPRFDYLDIPYRENLILNGYFQSEKYFLDQKDHIKKLFMPNNQTSEKDESKVGIHVRRGDYIKLSHVHSNLADKYDYYQRAMSKFQNKSFVFFSDDIEWCKNRFGPDHEYFKSDNEIKDFYKLASYPNKIIANSSFSWWAAWLGEEKNSKIIAPLKWFENKTSTMDLIPERWTRI